MTLRVVEPGEGAAAIRAVTAPTRMQQLEATLQIWLDAQRSLYEGWEASDGRKTNAAWDVMVTAAEATRLLLQKPEPPQAA